MQKAFDTFDVEKKGSIGTVMIGTILSMLGVHTTEKLLDEIIAEVDADGIFPRLKIYPRKNVTIFQVPVNWNLKNSSRWLLDSWQKKMRKLCNRNWKKPLGYMTKKVSFKGFGVTINY